MGMLKGLYRGGVDWFIGGIMSWITYYLFYFQPGVDRKAVLRALYNVYEPEPLVGVMVSGFLVLVAVPGFCLMCFGVLYHFEIPFFEQYRVDYWPRSGWNDPDPERRAAYAELNRKALKAFFVKQFFLLGVSLIGFAGARWMTNGEMFSHKYMEEDINSTPDAWTSVWQLAAGLIIFETLFYWGHRCQHWYFYASHKVHHEYTQPNALTAVWGADADGWLTLFLPGFAPVILFKYHTYTFMMWTTIHFAHTYLDHSGYEFPWSPLQLIPLSGYVRAHDFHHTANVCNYGLFWRVWDWIMGTDKEWIEHEAKRAAYKATFGVEKSSVSFVLNKPKTEAHGNGNGNGNTDTYKIS